MSFKHCRSYCITAQCLKFWEDLNNTSFVLPVLLKPGNLKSEFWGSSSMSVTENSDFRRHHFRICVSNPIPVQNNNPGRGHLVML